MTFSLVAVHKYATDELQTRFNQNDSHVVAYQPIPPRKQPLYDLFGLLYKFTVLFDNFSDRS